jgi:hypothetical protein
VTDTGILEIKIEKSGGSISSCIFRGSELISGLLQQCFRRVPADNDEGGGGRSFANRRRKAGLDRYNIRVNTLDIKADDNGEVVMDVASGLVFWKKNMNFRGSSFSGPTAAGRPGFMRNTSLRKRLTGSGLRSVQCRN